MDRTLHEIKKSGYLIIHKNDMAALFATAQATSITRQKINAMKLLSKLQDNSNSK